MPPWAMGGLGTLLPPLAALAPSQAHPPPPLRGPQAGATSLSSCSFKDELHTLVLEIQVGHLLTPTLTVLDQMPFRWGLIPQCGQGTRDRCGLVP